LNVLELAKYPFLDRAREYAGEVFDLTLEELGDDNYKHVWDRAVNRIMEAIKERVVHQDIEDLFDYRTEILSFPLAIALVACINDNRLREIFSLAEARRARLHLNNESAPYLIDFAGEIGVFAREGGGEFGVSVLSYLKFATAFKGATSWKLVNRVVTKGYVLVNNNEFRRLVQEAIKEKIYIKTLKEVSPNDFPESCLKVIQEIKEQWNKVVKEQAKTPKIGLRAMPPCIERLKVKIEGGENLSHFERFALATYLLNTDKGVDDVMEVFSLSPDFNASVTRYQIEHLAGLRGSKKKYTTPNCDAMRKSNLCYPDVGCDGINNPLSYKKAVKES